MTRVRSVARPLAALAAIVLSFPLVAVSRSPERGARAMVASPETRATEVGLEALRRGGKAMDAAIATAFALSVTYPRAGSLGGGGFLLYREPGGLVHALDFRETAPAALRPSLFLDESGRPVPERAQRGGLAVGVPGVVAGLAEAHRRWGSRPWGELVAASERLARTGFPVTRATSLTLEEAGERLTIDPGAHRIFVQDGSLLREGDPLVQRDLARTLKRVARKGPEGFYQGPVAASIVRAVRTAGGLMTLEDLAGYRPLLREPLVGTYRGHRIVAFPPPSSGGVALLQILGMLERFDVGASAFGSSLTVHRVVEAGRRAFVDRSRWLGDPGFFDVPLGSLLDARHVSRQAATIRDDVATPSSDVEPAGAAAETETTLHFTVADEDGGVVALTTTLNSEYGAGLVAPGTGILLNNEMDDFSLGSGVPNQFGLLGGDANAVAGGKRPLSSMSPTIVETLPPGRRPRLALGSPGGPTIISSVVQVILNVLDHGMTLQEAVDAPRFHHQAWPDRIDHEERAFPEDVVRALRGRGHALHQRPLIGNVCAVGLDRDGSWTGAADPRGEGSAKGY